MPDLFVMFLIFAVLGVVAAALAYWLANRHTRTSTRGER